MLGSSRVKKTIKHAETADLRQGRSLPNMASRILTR